MNGNENEIDFAAIFEEDAQLFRSKGEGVIFPFLLQGVER